MFRRFCTSYCSILCQCHCQICLICQDFFKINFCQLVVGFKNFYHNLLHFGLLKAQDVENVTGRALLF